MGANTHIRAVFPPSPLSSSCYKIGQLVFVACNIKIGKVR